MSDLYMQDERYLAALVRIKALIENGLKLSGYDDTTPGCKSTECTWGLCQNDKAHWPDPNDYLWPDTPDRIVPKYLTTKQKCPMDKRENNKVTLNGCFYTCRFFNKSVNPSRETVINLYERQIAYTQKRIGVKNV